MNFSAFEAASVIFTLLLGTINIAQFLFARKTNALHVNDIDTIYIAAYRTVEELDEALGAAGRNDLARVKEALCAAKARVNGVRELCQARVEYLEKRKPRLRQPWDAQNQSA